MTPDDALCNAHLKGGACMSAIDSTNRAVFEQFFARREPGAMANVNEQDFIALSKQITPTSTLASLARRFRLIVKKETYDKLIVEETKRIFHRFLKDRFQKLVIKQLEERNSSNHKESFLPALSSLRQDPTVTRLELKQIFGLSKEMELASKQIAFVPSKSSTHPLVISQSITSHEPAGVFKVLSGQQMAGELSSYLIGLYCGIDAFHTVVPSYVWLKDSKGTHRAQGVFSQYHENTHTAFELSCAKSESFEALKKIPSVCVQAICLMHMLRGSEDAHMGNTLVRLIKDPATGELCVSRIYEIDGEHIMSSSKTESDHVSERKQMASMRIWWLGLPQAAEPLDNSVLKLILSWSAAKLRDLHQQMNLYPEAKISAQLWRLEKMKTMAREALFNKRPINVRDLFFELIHRHPTLGLLSKTSDDDVWIYNQLGGVSADEILALSPSSTTMSCSSSESFNEKLYCCETPSLFPYMDEAGSF